MAFLKCDLGAWRDCVVPPFELEILVVAADEEEGGEGAVVGVIGGMGVRGVGEVLCQEG